MQRCNIQHFRGFTAYRNNHPYLVLGHIRSSPQEETWSPLAVPHSPYPSPCSHKSTFCVCGFARSGRFLQVDSGTTWPFVWFLLLCTMFSRLVRAVASTSIPFLSAFLVTLHTPPFLGSSSFFLPLPFGPRRGDGSAVMSPRSLHCL